MAIVVLQQPRRDTLEEIFIESTRYYTSFTYTNFGVMTLA
jgi:hypothetical protein